jgi:hypothetical protein
MRWRLPASRTLFALGILLVAGALAMLVAASALPSSGFEDLGRIVGALLLAGGAGVAFALALLLARGTTMPRWMVVVAALGCLLALLPAIGLLTAGVTNGALFGALFLGAAVAGLVSAVGLWRRRAATA